MGRILGDHSPEKFGDFRRYFGLTGKLDVFFLHDHDKFSDVIAFEGAEPEEHPEEDYSQRPNVGLNAVLFSFQHLGSHVNGRPQHRF